MKLNISKRNMLYAGLGVLALIIIIIAIILMMNSSSEKTYNENYGLALEAYISEDYSSAVDYCFTALEAQDTAECRILSAKSYYAMGNTSKALIDLYHVETYLTKDTSDNLMSQVASLIVAYEGDTSVEIEEEVDDDSVTINGKSYSLDTESISLRSASLTSDDLLNISSLVNLTKLSLEDCGISDISFVSTLVNLDTLILSDNNITDVSALKNLSNLYTLYLDGNAIEDFSPICSLTELTTLNISDMEILDTQLNALTEALTKCRIYSEEATIEVIEITLGDVTFTSEDTEVDLSGQNISDISALIACPLLETLILDDNNISDISVLIDLPNLTSISLANNKISDISPLLGLVNLEFIDISGNSVTNFAPILGLTKLTSLYLDEVNLSDENLAKLSALTSLKTLSVLGNEDLTEETMDALKASLPACSISHDDLKVYVTLGDATFEASEEIVNASSKNVSDLSPVSGFTAVTTLNLSDNSISDISALSSLSSLSILDLSSNATLSSLAGISSIKTLTELYLSDTAVADVWDLGSLTNLKVLKLDNTAVTDLTQLYTLSKLEVLSISGCEIEDAAVAAFMSMLPNCTVVR